MYLLNHSLGTLPAYGDWTISTHKLDLCGATDIAVMSWAIPLHTVYADTGIMQTEIMLYSVVMMMMMMLCCMYVLRDDRYDGDDDDDDSGDDDGDDDRW